MKNEVAAVVGVGPGLGAALVKRFCQRRIYYDRGRPAGLKLDQLARRR